MEEGGEDGDVGMSQAQKGSACMINLSGGVSAPHAHCTLLLWPPKTAPTERNPLGSKHGCLVGIGGQISAPCARRVRCSLSHCNPISVKQRKREGDRHKITEAADYGNCSNCVPFHFMVRNRRCMKQWEYKARDAMLPSPNERNKWACIDTQWSPFTTSETKTGQCL